MISFWKKVHFFKILLLDINLGYISNMKNPGGAHLPPVEFLKCYNWQLPYGICNTLWMNQRRIGWYWPMCIWFVRCQWHAIHFCPIQGGIPLHSLNVRPTGIYNYIRGRLFSVLYSMSTFVMVKVSIFPFRYLASKICTLFVLQILSLSVFSTGR